MTVAANLLDQPIFQTALAAFRPETAAAMEPLFAAITHGCLAERQDECFKEVYRPRVARGNENFAANKLGLYGQELAALASFFARPFASPSPNLNPGDQVLVLNLAGFRLRAIGRLPDAVEPFRADSKMSEDQGDLKGAATGYGNLSELLVTLGRLEDEPAGEASSRAAGALSTAARAVEFADQSGDLFWRMATRASNHAAALLASGDLAGAEARFREAERLQAQRQPALPRLFSLSGFLYGDLLLARARAAEVAERGEYMIRRSISDTNTPLTTSSLETLLAARAAAVLAPPGSGPAPLAAFPAARDALQKANVEHHLIRGYLAHAEALLHAAEAGDAADQKVIGEALTEAETIATRGPMPLFLAEAKLLRARAARLAGDRAAAQSFRDEAARLIAQHRYGRRRPDLAVLDAELEALGFRREAAGEASAPAGAAFRRACEAVAAGWWHLLPRLERLAAHHPAICDAAPVAALRTKEAEYNAERDAYLAKQDSPDPEPDEATGLDGLMGMMHEMILDQLPAEVIAQVAQQTGLPADWRQWPKEVKAHVAKLWLEAQGGGEK